MSDINISPTGPLQHVPKQFKLAYLIVLADGKNTRQFLASYMEETSTCVKAIGIFSPKSEEEIASSYQEILNSSDKALYKEMWFPWTRVISMQNLIYRSK